MVNMFILVYRKTHNNLQVFYNQIIYRHGKYVSIQKDKSKLIYNVFYNQIIYRHGKYISIQKDRGKINL